MPIRQWKRHAEVLVGAAAAGKGLVVRDPNGTNPGPRIKFEITKTAGRTPNAATVWLYNLTPDHEGQIKGEYDEFIVNAGYEGDVRLVFAGNIRHTFRYRDGTDYIMQIDGGDGDSDLRNTIVNATFAKGTTNSQVLDHIIKKFKSTKKGHMVVADKARIRGRVVSGMARDVFDKIAAESDASWSIQDGALIFVPVNATLPNEAIVVRSDTGLIGAPELDDKGVKFTCLMNPQLRVGGKVKLDNNAFRGKVLVDHKVTSTTKPSVHHRLKPKTPKKLSRLDPDGIYKVFKLVHKGDTRGQEWISEVECVALEKTLTAGKGT